MSEIERQEDRQQKTATFVKKSGYINRRRRL